MAKKKEITKEPSRKVQLSFTLQKSVNDRYLAHCKEHTFNKSQKLENIIVAYLDSIDFAGMEKRV